MSIDGRKTREGLMQLKEFLAAQWCISKDEISDAEAIGYRRKRWSIPAIAFPSVCGTYFYLHTTGNDRVADLFLIGILVVTTALAACARYLQKPLGAGQTARTKLVMADRYAIASTAITASEADEFNRVEWKAIFRGWLIFLMAFLLGRWLWPSLAADLVALFFMLAVCTVSVWSLWKPRRMSRT